MRADESVAEVWGWMPAVRECAGAVSSLSASLQVQVEWAGYRVGMALCMARVPRWSACEV